MNPAIKMRIQNIINGTVCKGYIKTKVGVFPVDWKQVRFGDLFSRLQTKNKNGCDNVLTISAQYGLINQGDFFNKDIASEDKSNYFLLKKGDWAYNKSYSSGYPFGAIKRLDKYEKGIVSPLYICFADSKLPRCSNFYSHYFENGLMDKGIKAIAQEGARNHGLLNIGVQDFFNLPIMYPPVEEQEKIAEILDAQDRIIKLKERLLEEKKLQKKYLMQQLLTGKKRLPGFSDEWEKVCFGNLIIEKDERTTKNNQFEILSVTKDGIQKQSEHFVKQIASQDNTGYKIIKRHQLAISVLNLWMGSLDVLTLCDIGIISPAYKVYDFAKGIMDPIFGRYFLKSYDVIWLYNICSEQGASVVRKNLDFDALYKMKVKVPKIEEQRIIANVLFSKDQEIELIQKTIEQEKQKKKALMQLLLTGIVRTFK